jgi:hypothetical protein
MSLSSKRALVLKMLQVIRAGRWEYDRSEQGLVRAFNAVRKVVTPGGFITYETDRSRRSHGDMAWATMLSIINEPLGGEWRRWFRNGMVTVKKKYGKKPIASTAGSDIAESLKADPALTAFSGPLSRA